MNIKLMRLAQIEGAAEALDAVTTLIEQAMPHGQYERFNERIVIEGVRELLENIRDEAKKL